MAAKLRKRTLDIRGALADDRSLTFFRNQNLLPGRAVIGSQPELPASARVVAIDMTRRYTTSVLHSLLSGGTSDAPVGRPA
jgi:hypothetical protein